MNLAMWCVTGPAGLQGEAIAVNLREMFGFRVPIISVVIGEGGSGGALAIGCSNWNLIMEHSVYYVASPEACAAILWKSRDKAATVRSYMRNYLLAQTMIPYWAESIAWSVCVGCMTMTFGDAEAWYGWTCAVIALSLVCLHS